MNSNTNFKSKKSGRSSGFFSAKTAKIRNPDLYQPYERGRKTRRREEKRKGREGGSKLGVLEREKRRGIYSKK
jgi:hypothetical protein